MSSENKAYRATLVITSQSVGAEQIQAILGIAGDTLIEKGTKLSDRPGSKIFEHSGWKLKSAPGEEQSIDCHIEALVDLMEMKKIELSKLAENCSIEIWCFISFESSQCGFVLQKELLNRVAALPCELVFDIYS